jgi:predicted  nucleic acid-binding Zn-ribbon protein
MNLDLEQCLKLIEILELNDEDTSYLQLQMECLDDFRDYRLKAVLSNSFSEKNSDVIQFYKQLMDQRKVHESSHIVMHEVEKLRISFVSLQNELDVLSKKFVDCMKEFSELNGDFKGFHERMVDWEKSYIQLRAKVAEL